MRKTYIFTLAFVIISIITILSSPRYTGNVVGLKDTRYMLDNMEEVKDGYNANIENIPGFFKTLFGNEIINLSIDMQDGSQESVFIKTSRGKIITLDENEIENPTLSIWTDESTINNISNSSDQIRSINKALKEQKLRYRAIRFKTKFKAKVAGIGFRIWNMLN